MLRKDRFDEREQDFYEALYTQVQWVQPQGARGRGGESEVDGGGLI
jgi:hypothetical protein